MRVIVCGSRTWRQYARLARRLDQLPRDGLVIVHGKAMGADSCANDWASDRGVPVEPFPANWRVHGKSAGPRRNQEMLDAGADLVLAFRCLGESCGTDHMVCLAQRSGVPVEVIEETTL